MHNLIKSIHTSDIILILEKWLALGLFIQLLGSLVFDHGYRTWVYFGFYLPLILLFLVNWKNILSELKINSTLYLLLFSFIFYYSLSNLWSDNSNLSNELKASLLCILYIVGVSIISKKEQLLYITLSATLIYVALFSLLFIVQNYLINNQELNHRLSNTGFEGWNSLNHPQVFAIYLGTFFTLGIMLLRIKTPSIIKIILFIASILILIAAFFTYSRTMWIALFFTLLCYLYINKYHTILRYGTLLLLSSSTIILFIFPEIFDRFIYRDGLSFRPQNWLLTLSYIVDKPLLGYGSNATFHYTVTQMVNGIKLSCIIPHPHNLYLSIFYFSGLIGLTLYLAMLTKLLVSVKKYLHDDFVWLALGILLFSLSVQLFEIAEIVTKPNKYYMIMWLPIGIFIGRKVHLTTSPKELKTVYSRSVNK